MKAGSVIPALVGLLFGAGLMISGMADYNKVLAFLRLAPTITSSRAGSQPGASRRKPSTLL